MKPTLSQFDAWKAAGQWYFEVYLQGYADATAEENGRSVGNRGATLQDDYMILAKMAGVVEGVEFAITSDPFADEREEMQDEDTGDR